MHERFKEWLVDKLLEVANAAIRGEIPKEGFVNTWDIDDPIKGSIKFSLAEDQIRELNEIQYKTIPKFNASDKFSEARLRNYVIELLQSALLGRNKEEILSELNNYLEYIKNYDIEHTIYLPIEGFDFDSNTLKVGDVQFSKITDINFLKIIGSHNTGTGQVFASFRVKAELERAYELAREAVEIAVDILRYVLGYIDVVNNEQLLEYKDLDSNSDKSYDDNVLIVGIRDETPSLITRFPIIQANNSANHLFYFEVKRSKSFIINIEKHFKESGASEVIDTLNTNNQLSDFEKAILLAIRWFSFAEIQATNQNKILALITCLEIFLSTNRGSPISETVAEGAALIIRDSLQERLKVKKRIKFFYDQRSSITHSGQGKGLLSRDVEELKNYVYYFLREMIRRKKDFQSRNQVFEWIEHQKLS